MRNNNGFVLSKTPEGKVSVSNQSMLTGLFNVQDWDIPYTTFLRGYEEWLAGKYIQDAMPFLNDNQREFVMSGITEEEWDSEFKDM